jgi:hypothetical protein
VALIRGLMTDMYGHCKETCVPQNRGITIYIKLLPVFQGDSNNSLANNPGSHLTYFFRIFDFQLSRNQPTAQLPK